ncbi:plancitoxin-1-like [Physella acuta]|uniref:plancitoxin-1-like n=1 Tax=Physella acuta TaxID=109671 RepID=UPI0027DCBFC5|nr:plancitoxin-1-like [Physella acuta]XP_059175344.1 plancitoxin-1-like [Physella acuta]XP_059175345.1 plancitoxin-1-like [Physella acuta]XP_059175346.1 plancitoxin-1-like [Physella acuta]
MRMVISFQFLLFFLNTLTFGGCYSCVDPNGNMVDWFMAYKTPKLKQPRDWRFKDGLALYYLDVNSPTLKLSEYSINDTQSPISRTLGQVYDHTGEDLTYIMYNDEDPLHSLDPSQGAASTGHTKGVLGFDGLSGFWLVHSAPKFPPNKTSGYSWETSASIYGQTFLCITFPYQELGQIGQQLHYNEPNIYDYHIPQQVLDKFPVFIDLIKKTHVKSPPWFSILTLKSSQGQIFTSFAKSRKFEADLYDSLVAPNLQQNLLVETWLRSRGEELPSNCTAQFEVCRITNVQLPGSQDFSETQDHAKWAVSLAGTSQKLFYQSEKSPQTTEPWTCIGDINRMKSQFSRGGGTVCLQNADVWQSFKTSVTKYDSC